jgi:hypothetical protein
MFPFFTTGKVPSDALLSYPISIPFKRCYTIPIVNVEMTNVETNRIGALWVHYSPCKYRPQGGFLMNGTFRENCPVLAISKVLQTRPNHVYVNWMIEHS